MSELLKAGAPLELKLQDADAGAVSGYGATFNDTPDSYGDVILPGAFTKSLAGSSGRLPMLWSHDQARPCGSWHVVREDSRGLLVEGKFNLGTTSGREALAHVKAGDVTGLSIGYGTPSGGRKSVRPGVYHLSEIALHEVSIVAIPANPSSRIMLKSALSGDDFAHFLTQAGLSERDAERVAARGWDALQIDTETEEFNHLAGLVKAAAAELKGMKI